MQTVNNLLDLLIYNLQNLYAAEDLVQQSFLAIIAKVNHQSVRNALQHHFNLTEEQKRRLEEIADILNKRNAAESGLNVHLKPGSANKGITGLIDEAKELLEAPLSYEVTDAAIISVVQKIEHYEICAYGSAHAYAVQLQLHRVASLLQETLQEEYDADDLLTALATAAINKEAIPSALLAAPQKPAEDVFVPDKNIEHTEVSINERTINSPGGRAGTSHRGYGNGESRGH